MFIERPLDVSAIKKRLQSFRVTAILGPRQCGKTTLSKSFVADHYFDLENPADLQSLEQPNLTLGPLTGLIAIDEIQRKPELFPTLRYLVDSRPAQTYLILGSASKDLIRQSSESLAGRISYYTLGGLRKEDVGAGQWERLWRRGGLPPSFLAETDAGSFEWRKEYIGSFLERDIPNLGIRIPPAALRRFWMMSAHYHGNVVQYSEIGRSLALADTTIRRYFDILEGTFMVRFLYPWHENIGKRLVKRPKLYISDSGVLHSLLAIESETAFLTSPKIGASWEGFALECVWRAIGKRNEEAYFWSTHNGAELDLVWIHDGTPWGCEFKYMDAPKITKSMLIALQDLRPGKMWVIYPGTRRYHLHPHIEAVPLVDIPSVWSYE
jgi:hypothetical protein